MSEELTVSHTAMQPGDVIREVLPGGMLKVQRDGRPLCPPCRIGEHHNHQLEVMDHQPCECHQSGCKYTQQQLSDAFDLVKNPDGWKLPVSKVLPARQVADVTESLLSEAVIYFTGSLPEIFPDPVNPGYVRVEASGYYACIGS